MSQSNFHEWRPDLVNTGTLETSGPTPNGIVATDTSAAGTPTYAYVDGASEGGEIEVAMDSTAEVQNVSLTNGDSLPFDIDRLVEAKFRFKMAQSALDSTSQFAIGLASDRNDAIDSITEAVLLRVVGADDTTAVVVETDDGTNNNDDVATGKVLDDQVAHDFVISFANGKSDVKMYLDGQPLAPNTTFDMSNYSGALQFFAQIQKTADANTNGFNLLGGGYVRGRNVLSPSLA